MKRFGVFGILAITAIALASAGVSTRGGRPGILLLAHGGSKNWNVEVEALASRLARSAPTAVALGMAPRASIQSAIDKLEAAGVTDIAAVPLFVSSHSPVVESTRYLLGLRDTAPADLAVFERGDILREAGRDRSRPSVRPVLPGRWPCIVTLEWRPEEAVECASIC